VEAPSRPRGVNDAYGSQPQAALLSERKGAGSVAEACPVLEELPPQLRHPSPREAVLHCQFADAPTEHQIVNKFLLAGTASGTPAGEIQPELHLVRDRGDRVLLQHLVEEVTVGLANLR